MIRMTAFNGGGDAICNLGFTRRQPHLFGTGWWKRLAVDGIFDDLAHSLEPPMGAGEAALAPTEASGAGFKTHL